MKIAWIRYPEPLYKSGKVVRGGSEIANQQIINSLRTRGLEVLEFSPSGERLKLIEIPGIGTPLMFQDLIKQIDQINSCDILVTTNWFGAILPEIKIPLVVVFHSNATMVSDAIKPNNINEKENLDKWLKKAVSYNLASKSDQPFHEDIISTGEKYFCENADKIIAVSDKLKTSLVNNYKAKEEKITVIHNPYPQEWEKIKPERKEKGSVAVVCVTRMPGDYSGFVGKGADRIFEVFSAIGEEIKKRLIISTTNKNYRNMIEKEISGLELYENASRDTVAEKLIESQISIHCSRAEACQMTLIEAMFWGSVPVSFNVGVAGELIENSVNGFMVESIDEMVSKINLLKNDADKLKMMSENAKKTIREKIKIKSITDQYLQIFSSLL